MDGGESCYQTTTLLFTGVIFETTQKCEYFSLCEIEICLTMINRTRIWTEELNIIVDLFCHSNDNNHQVKLIINLVRFIL